MLLPANSSLCRLFLASTFPEEIRLHFSACNKPDVFLLAVRGGGNVVTGQLGSKMDSPRGWTGAGSLYTCLECLASCAPPPFLYGCKLLLIISLDIYKALCFIFTTASGCLQSPARLSFKVFQTNADTACLPMEDAEFNHLHARQSRDGFLLRQYFGATSKGTKDGILRSDSRAE